MTPVTAARIVLDSGNWRLAGTRMRRKSLRQPLTDNPLTPWEFMQLGSCIPWATVHLPYFQKSLATSLQQLCVQAKIDHELLHGIDDRVVNYCCPGPQVLVDEDVLRR